MNQLETVIPECLRECSQWVAWKYIQRDGKKSKAPINPFTGNLASSTDPSDWGSFTQATEACQLDSKLAGVGFVFTADDPYCGVDLDNCIDAESGQLKSWAADFLVQLDSYAETSPSGTGVKVFIKANKPGRRCRKAHQDGEIEIYDRDRFFTVTGERLQEYPTDVNLRQESLDLVYASVFGDDEPGETCKSSVDPSPPTDDCATVVLSDDEIVELACNKPKAGEKFRSLWEGRWNDCFNSASEADSSLIFFLAYYTKDAHQLDRMFRQSRLMRPKWDEMHGSETYGATTIAKALSKVVKQYPAKARRRRAARQPSPPSIGIPKSGIDWEFKSDQTENAMAVEFIDASQTQLRYVPPWKKWLAWDGKRWKMDIDSSRTTRLARRLVRKYWDRLEHIPSEEKQKKWAEFCRWANGKTSIENIVSLARCDARTTIDHDHLNQNAYFLNLQNGTIDLSTGEFREHRQTDSITQIANVSYDPKAECPKWKAFLDLIFGNDDEAKRYIQALKELTGDEHITARRMREDYWSFRRTHKFWLSTNHLPQISGTDEGIWRRIKLIPFRVDLRNVTEPIPDYHKLLIREEGPGILNWLLDGFTDWRENGFIEPKSIINETKSYRGQSDGIGRFLDDCCEVSPELVVASSDLYHAYHKWGGDHSQTRFSTMMQARFTCAKRTFGKLRNKQVFEGVSLSKADENAESNYE